MNREAWLDSLKGFAISLVVIGHCLGGFINAGLFQESSIIIGIIYNFIYSFHMPLFFLISGYVFMMAKIYKNTLTRVADMLLLYFEWSFMFWLVKYITPSKFKNPATIVQLIESVYKPINGAPYWYLYDMAIITALASIQLWQKKDIKHIVLPAIAVSVITSMIFVHQNELMKSIYYFSFFLLGAYFYQIKGLLLSNKATTYLLLTISSVFGYCRFTSDTPIFSFAWAAAISTLCFFLFLHLRILNENKVLMKMGYYCLPIYLIHMFITISLKFLYNYTGYFGFWVWLCFGTILAISISILVYKVCNHVTFAMIIFEPVKTIKKLLSY